MKLFFSSKTSSSSNLGHTTPLSQTLKNASTYNKTYSDSIHYGHSTCGNMIGLLGGSGHKEESEFEGRLNLNRLNDGNCA